MKSFTYVITHPDGLDVHPAAALNREIRSYKSDIVIHKGEKLATPRLFMQVLQLGIRCGETVTVTVEGENEEQEAKLLEAYFKANL